MNFYKHHLGDYDGATAHISWNEDMAYTRLLRAYYRREKPLVDATEACRLIRATTPQQKAAVTTVLSEFFEQQPDGWHNKRADEEITAYQSQATHNRVVGNLGGRPRKTTVVSKNNHSGFKTKPINNPNQEPLTTNQEPEPIKTKTARKLALPDDWVPKDSTSQRLGLEFGLRVPEDIDRYVTAFRDACKAKGYTYADFDAAFSNCVRQDWPKFRETRTVGDRKLAY